MAENNISSNKLSDELKEVVSPAFTVRALLQGAMALLDEAEHMYDSNGDIWAARMLVSDAWEKVAEIYGDKENCLRERLAEIDKVTV